MTVEFTRHGPRSEGLLLYSQASDPSSAHHADQTRHYARKVWDPLRFTAAEVVAGTVRKAVIAG